MFNKLEKLRESGKINEHMYQNALLRLAIMPSKFHEAIVKDAELLSGIGVKSDDDHKQFLYISMHLKRIAKDMSASSLTDEDLARLSALVFAEKDVYPIDTIFNFYKAASNALGKMNIPIRKIAYPSFGAAYYDSVDPRDLRKWLQTMRHIYAHMHRGLNFNQALNIVTAKWDVMEKNDFKHWVRYYQEGTHLKYKMAQTSSEHIDPSGINIPYDSLRANLPMAGSFGLPTVEQESEYEIKKQREAERKELVNKKIRSIIGRLNAAERLATDPDVLIKLRDLLDVNPSSWLEILHKLKRSIQTAPMRSARSTILEDLIVREGNLQINNGNIKTGKYLISMAQDMMEVDDSNELDEQDPVEEFVERMNFNYYTEEDAEEEGDDELLATAQFVPPAPPPERKPMPPRAAPKPDIEVEEEPRPEPEPEPKPEPDDVPDLKNVTIEGVINRLEGIVSVLKHREIPRQLSYADIELDALGFASFFPTLGEASRSALESNQYMLTRVEDILSKLKGSVEPSEKEKVDLAPSEEDTKNMKDTMDDVKERLSKEENKEKAMKERRKEIREKKELSPEPIKSPEKELAGPVTIERPPTPRPVR